MGSQREDLTGLVTPRIYSLELPDEECSHW